MKHLSLFSGIGGFDLAAQWAGWENVAQVEIDHWCRRILKKHFPHAQQFEDIRTFDGTAWMGSVDVISGGFPCQPYSSAGRQKGKEDERHLWPEMLRVIREIGPSWVVGENVFGIVNWSGGLVFDEVQSDLEAAGYEVQAYVLPAASVNAPHQRYRVWFVAHSPFLDDRRNAGEFSTQEWREEWDNLPESISAGEIRDVANPQSIRCKRGRNTRSRGNGFANNRETLINTNGARLEKRARIPKNNAEKFPAIIAANYRWERWTIESPLCGRNDGVPNRVDRLRGLGNAIVPQVALQIFETINEYEYYHRG